MAMSSLKMYKTAVAPQDFVESPSTRPYDPSDPRRPAEVVNYAPKTEAPILDGSQIAMLCAGGAMLTHKPHFIAISLVAAVRTLLNQSNLSQDAAFIGAGFSAIIFSATSSLAIYLPRFLDPSRAI